ncbi:MAG: hypothetical protein V2J14_08770 [Erythrobacter sp.]|jgi:hypothetical protein|nr:hypothetical protein [Erythrobacter sp.]
MTPYLFRTIGLALIGFAAAIALVWALQAAGLVELIDNPLPGIVLFGGAGLVMWLLGKRGAGHHSPEPPER